MDMTRINKLMKALGITEDEAIQLIKDDEAIDAGEKLFELTTEQKKASKKARATGSHETTAKPGPKTRKVDSDKHDLFNMLTQSLTDFTNDAVTVTTEDRQLDFEFNGRKFRIVLSAPRK